ncbi:MULTISPECIES: hypothetical protein [unclassified Nonomuraea]|uniref:hypothetical protein n=1 Tax=unclassified Nonomuraea TaxID=2593643 RepID=UPI0035C132E2
MSSTDEPRRELKKEFPWGYGVLCVLATTLMAALMTQQRGLVPGIVAGAAIGAMTLPSVVSTAHANAWAARRPLIGAAMYTVAFFLVFSLFPGYTLIHSAAVGVVAGVLFGLFLYVRNRRST